MQHEITDQLVDVQREHVNSAVEYMFRHDLLELSESGQLAVVPYNVSQTLSLRAMPARLSWPFPRALPARAALRAVPSR